MSHQDNKHILAVVHVFYFISGYQQHFFKEQRLPEEVHIIYVLQWSQL